MTNGFPDHFAQIRFVGRRASERARRPAVSGPAADREVQEAGRPHHDRPRRTARRRAEAGRDTQGSPSGSRRTPVSTYCPGASTAPSWRWRSPTGAGSTRTTPRREQPVRSSWAAITRCSTRAHARTPLTAPRSCSRRAGPERRPGCWWSAGSITAKALGNPAAAPPGYYQLIAVDAAGTPSPGRMVRGTA
ncbi:galactose oxidase-like domain-containing protein [Streptomyces sp. NPDC090052]|uniref:galactose oxidase-like domain-containing protein n=1 Tax=Streptomyces sp. NPDC090052 TaxID=3365931 RepID=UPI00382F7A4C